MPEEQEKPAFNSSGLENRWAIHVDLDTDTGGTDMSRRAFMVHFYAELPTGGWRGSVRWEARGRRGMRSLVKKD